ncbi:Imm53 family immunity protein [Streptomyces sp. NPDC056653]
MSDAEPLLDWLQNRYAQQCDGDWEHEWGVKIATLDNPG